MIEKTISVIVPIYNAEDKLQTMIDCLKTQTFDDFEVYLIDDGSTDDSGNICDIISRNDNRFVVIHQPNKGVSFARNKGISKSSGEFIAFLDADDEIPTDYLETLYLTQQSTNADIVICDVVMINDNREINRFTYNEITIDKMKALDCLLSRQYINSGPCAKLFRKSTIKDISFPDLKTYEDIIFVVEAVDKSNAISVTNNTEYRYIHNEDGAMSNFSKTPSTDIVAATTQLVEFIKKKKGLSPECIYATLSHLMQYVQSIDKKDENSKLFISESRKIYRKNIRLIIGCQSFPWKEKLMFLLFSIGLFLP